jgi:SAM-dependent methyltransferase
MKNQEQWAPSKFVQHNGRWVASRAMREVAPGDRLIADLVVALYDTYLPQYARGRLVDLGCGQVPLFGIYQPHVSDVTCVDWGNSPHRTNHLDYECDLTQPLPFAPGEYDTILLSDVLEHIPEPEQLWQEMSRILSPGGTVLLNVPFYFRVHEEPYDFYRYTEFALSRFAERAGFEVLLLEPVGGTPEIFADLLGKHLRFVPLIGVALVTAVHAITRAFVRTSIGRRASAKTGRMFPLGYFMIARKTA